MSHTLDMRRHKSRRPEGVTSDALNEWLGSPIVYEVDQGFPDELKTLIPEYFNPKKKAMHHYLNMAEKTANKHLSDNTVNIKNFRTPDL